LWELCKDLEIVTYIKRKRMEWVRHLKRMDHGRVVMKIFENKPDGRKRKGRPRMR
jgi:metal-dependent HD superfamily phosphatase/phosphodiesterase